MNAHEKYLDKLLAVVPEGLTALQVLDLLVSMKLLDVFDEDSGTVKPVKEVYFNGFSIQLNVESFKKNVDT